MPFAGPARRLRRLTRYQAAFILPVIKLCRLAIHRRVGIRWSQAAERRMCSRAARGFRPGQRPHIRSWLITHGVFPGVSSPQRGRRIADDHLDTTVLLPAGRGAIVSHRVVSALT